MEITLGDKIKIDGKEVPEYLLKALYENLKSKFELKESLTALSITTRELKVNSSKAENYSKT